MVFNSKLIVFITIFASFFGCKHQKIETTNKSNEEEDTIKIPQDDTALSKIQILKSIIIPKEKNNLVDSVVVFGSDNNEFSIECIDSIFIYFKGGKFQKLYTIDTPHEKSRYEEMYFFPDHYCFYHLNKDNYIDIRFTSIYGGSGGEVYNIFLYDKKNKKYIYNSIISGQTNLEYLKSKDEYLGYGKSGPLWTLHKRFKIIRNKEYPIIDFITDVTPNEKYDTFQVSFTVIKNNDTINEKCYNVIDNIDKFSESTTCSSTIRKIQDTWIKDYDNAKKHK
jgi:hypothetical protein